MAGHGYLLALLGRGPGQLAGRLALAPGGGGRLGIGAAIAAGTVGTGRQLLLDLLGRGDAAVQPGVDYHEGGRTGEQTPAGVA